MEVAKREDFLALCDLGGGNCEEFLAQPEGHSVPPEPPEIVGGRVIEPTGLGSGRVGGYVLEMCGEASDGDPYYSEMLVFRDAAGVLRGIEPTYWMGIRITEDNEAGTHVGEDPAIECRSSGGHRTPA